MDYKKLKKALRSRYGLVRDFLTYRSAFKSIALPPIGTKGKLLFVAGRGMNITWAQMWTYLGVSGRAAGYTPAVILLRKQWLHKLYFKLVGARIYILEDCLNSSSSSFPISQLDNCHSVDDWKKIKHKNMPVGAMVISTYCRHNATGFIDPTLPDFLPFAKEWVKNICRAYDAAEGLYKKNDVKAAMFSETFIEEYGGFYYAALAAGLDVIKTSGTVRDNAIVVQRRRAENERLHHAALTNSAWEYITKLGNDAEIQQEVSKNFADRYSNKWLRSKRNHADTKIFTREEGRKQLGISQDRKVVVLFSHILYDALFHYGDELYQDYATWLVETIKIVKENPNIDWYIKLHPSNLWRGEFQSLLKGKYEEERIIEEYVGELPAHIKLIYADTNISPYGWYQIADYGISVRGTAGLEMPCLGKPVVTAGTGRYEGKGFTIDPTTPDDYRKILLSLHEVPPLSDKQIALANRYAYGLFNLKPFELSGLKPTMRFGVTQVKESDDLIYIPVAASEQKDLAIFTKFLQDKSRLDLLSGQ